MNRSTNDVPGVDTTAMTGVAGTAAHARTGGGEWTLPAPPTIVLPRVPQWPTQRDLDRATTSNNRAAARHALSSATAADTALLERILRGLRQL